MQWAKQKGFTIVELLIVVVVIAILAAITIVSFNGITQRTENTKTITAASTLMKAVAQYATDKSAYPTATNACLGASGTSCGNLTDATGACGGLGATVYKEALKTALEPYINTIPSASTQRMMCGGKEYGGALYHGLNSGADAQLRVFLKGDIDCPNMPVQNTKSKYQNSDTTICTYTLPTVQ